MWLGPTKFCTNIFSIFFFVWTNLIQITKKNFSIYIPWCPLKLSSKLYIANWKIWIFIILSIYILFIVHEVVCPNSKNGTKYCSIFFIFTNIYIKLKDEIRSSQDATLFFLLGEFLRTFGNQKSHSPLLYQ